MDILSLFTVPERTKAGYSFADTPVKISFKESNVVVYGVPLDATTSFGKGTARGPEATRLASARQIETFVLDEKADIYDLVKIFDLGDLKLPKAKSIAKTLAFLDSAIPKVVSSLRQDGKIPVMLGGEHTLSYYQLKALAKEEPVVIHFDAHRDMKPEYEGLKMCHTTPFYHLLKYIPGENLLQRTDISKNRRRLFNYFGIGSDVDNLLRHFDAKILENDAAVEGTDKLELRGKRVDDVTRHPAFRRPVEAEPLLELPLSLLVTFVVPVIVATPPMFDAVATAMRYGTGGRFSRRATSACRSGGRRCRMALA